MSEATALRVNPAHAHSNPKRSWWWSALKGMGPGMVIGVMGTGIEFLVRGRDLHRVPLPTYLLLPLLLGFALGWLLPRYPHALARVRPPDFFSVGPLPPEEAAVRGRRIRRFLWIGFGAGIAYALLASALDFAWRGWPWLAPTLITGLILYPSLGMLLSYHISLRPGDPAPSLSSFRFRMRTLMILVAYVALLFGLGKEAGRYSQLAQMYDSKCQNARMMVAVFQSQVEKGRGDLNRADNAKELRAGRIPDGVLPSQKEFLRGLEGTSTKAYKQYRYGLIADGEDRLAGIGARNLAEFSKLVAYEQVLAEKYAKAVQEPWVPVEPDPPRP